MPQLRDLTQEVFGDLQPLGLSPSTKGRYYRWVCECKCGDRRSYYGQDLTAGKSTQCRPCSRLKHGGTGSPEFMAWMNAKHRTSAAARGRTRRDWYERGIRMAPEWRASFSAFLEHVGKRPSPEHSLDRIDNDGHYEPGNVRWATRSEQMKNRRQRRRL